MSDTDGLLEGLPVLQRLALSYAPARAAPTTLALLALDVRLAAIVRSASEPMLAQIRLAWWREQLSKDWPEQPAGEPLLQILQDWEGGSQPLVGLINGWEEMTGEAPLASSALEALADARAKAFVALADQFGTAADREPALRLGQNWALADIAAHLSHPEERRVASQLARARDWRVTPMSRNMRPLAILHGLAARATRRGENLHELSPSAMFTVLRLGFFGR